MKRNASSAPKPHHLTRESVLDDLGFSRPEALEIQVKAEIYRELLRYIEERGFAQQELGSLLGMHQPDVSNLLRGKISRFSVGRLIKLASKLNLGAQVTLTKPEPVRLRTAKAQLKPRERVSSLT